MEEVGKSEIPKGQFRIDSKSWFLTWPKCSLDKEEVLAMLIAKGKHITGAVVCREFHEDGTPHVHAYVLLSKQFSCKNPKFWDLGGHHGHYEKARSIDSVVKYIKKDGDILEHGSITWKEKVESRLEHRRYLGKRLIDGESLQSVVQSDPSLMFGLSQLQKDLTAWHQLSLQPLHAPDVRGIWIYGPPGTGKTRYVYENEPSLYDKAQNKWWCGYIGQKAVLIDDFDKIGTGLSHYLKRWADRYPCTGEIKGGQVPLNHERLYVTSNYSIQELYPEDPHLQEALERRFQVIHWTDQSLGLKRARSNSVPK